MAFIIITILMMIIMMMIMMMVVTGHCILKTFSSYNVLFFARSLQASPFYKLNKIATKKHKINNKRTFLPKKILIKWKLKCVSAGRRFCLRWHRWTFHDSWQVGMMMLIFTIAGEDLKIGWIEWSGLKNALLIFCILDGYFCNNFLKTRPWPAFGRQGLVGSSGGYTYHRYTSHASPRACGALLGRTVSRNGRNVISPISRHFRVWK